MSYPRFRASLVLPSLSLLLSAVGCVPYQTYAELKDKVADLTSINADLVKKYNEAVIKLRSGGSAEASARLAQLEKENADLRREIGQGGGFTPKEIEGVPGAVEAPGGGLQLVEGLLFAEGSDRLRPEAFRVLDPVVELLRGGKYGEDLVIIEGHTDNQPIAKSNNKDNLDLGYKRARAVFEYFQAQGIAESRVIVHSYSCNLPLNPADQDSPDARRQNRRVVVRRAAGARM